MHMHGKTGTEDLEASTQAWHACMVRKGRRVESSLWRCWHWAVGMKRANLQQESRCLVCQRRKDLCKLEKWVRVEIARRKMS